MLYQQEKRLQSLYTTQHQELSNQLQQVCASNSALEQMLLMNSQNHTAQGSASSPHAIVFQPPGTNYTHPQQSFVSVSPYTPPSLLNTPHQAWLQPGFQQPMQRPLRLDFPCFSNGDPSNWLFKVQIYFSYYAVPPLEFLLLASLHLDGPAADWYQGLADEGLLFDWPMFVEALHNRFDPSEFNDAIGAIARLTQTGSVADYQVAFEQLVKQVKGMSSEALKSQFVSGLKPNIRRSVLLMRPTTRHEAFAIAQLHEDQLTEEHAQSRQWNPRQPSPSTTPTKQAHIGILSDSADTEANVSVMNERSESDKLVDAIQFGDLCNDFECISSPSVEATARQLARDISELRQGNRSLESYYIFVKYKDPVRTFIGREKYNRPLWATVALENPSVTLQAMQMLSTSELSIKWLLKGWPKNPVFATLVGELILQINSRFTLNQISGQVIAHEELWDLSASSVVGRSYFWISRRLFSTIEAGKDAIDAVKSFGTDISSAKESRESYPDLSGDPTKFFQRDDDFLRDAYQIALFLAVIYFVVQFLRTIL